jgi:hypothetical protein
VTDPKTSPEIPPGAVRQPRPYGRLRSGRNHSTETVVEQPAVEIPTVETWTFQASPTTFAALLAKAESRPTLSLEAQIVEGATRGTSTGGAAPVFVIGADHAQRELLRSLLASHPNFSCGPESPALAELAKAVQENQDNLAHHGYPEQYWFRAAATSFDSFQTEQAAAGGKSRWVELIDESELPLETLDRMFPRSLVVHIVADGWSHRRSQRTVRAAAARLSAGRYLEVRLSDLESDPTGTLGAILEFAGEA